VKPWRRSNPTLAAHALFYFDKRSPQHLLPESVAQLGAFAKKINAMNPSSLLRIELIGYTDLLGTEEYNETLGLDRANTVKRYLQAKGIAVPMTTAGRGKSSPVVSCPSGPRATPQLTGCLQPNRRVEVRVIGR
jgi:OmpA-OmpF porin, OOP family